MQWTDTRVQDYRPYQSMIHGAYILTKPGTPSAPLLTAMTDREAKSRAVKILAKSIYRDLEAQGFDEKQIVALATELISEVTINIARNPDKAQQLA